MSTCQEKWPPAPLVKTRLRGRLSGLAHRQCDTLANPPPNTIPCPSMKNPTSTPRPEIAMQLVTAMRIERTNVVDVEKICRWFRQILTTFLGPLEASDVTQVSIVVDIDSSRPEYKRLISTTIAEIHAAVESEVKAVGKNIDVIVDWFRSKLFEINAGRSTAPDTDDDVHYFGTMRGDSLTVSFGHPALRRKDVNPLPNMPLTKKFAGGKTFGEVPTATAETFPDRPVITPDPGFLTVGREHSHPQGLCLQIVDTGSGYIEIEITAPYGGWEVGERVLLYRRAGNFGSYESNEQDGKAIISLSSRPDPR